MSKLTPCPECGNMISKKAKTCPHCGAKKGASLLVKVAFSAVILYAVVSLGSDPQPSTSTPNQTGYSSHSFESIEAGIQKNSPLLKVLSWECHTEGSWQYITGEVVNISDKSLRSVAAAGSFYTSDGTFVKSEESLIDYNPIMPNQKSPFKVMTSANPQISRCNLDMKELYGASIPSIIDDRG